MTGRLTRNIKATTQECTGQDSGTFGYENGMDDHGNTESSIDAPSTE